MFDRDQLEIERWAAHSPVGTEEVGVFVLLSIRSQFSGLGRQLERVRTGDTAPLWGWKLAGARYLHDRRAYLHRRVRECRLGKIWVEDLMRDYLSVPGLGLVKAGFAVQLLTGEVGCLDMHNVERLGLHGRDFTIPTRKNPDAQLRVIDACIADYMQLCEDCGGAATLWNSWCAWVAETYRTYEDADDVSRRHVTYLTGRP